MSKPCGCYERPYFGKPPMCAEHEKQFSKAAARNADEHKNRWITPNAAKGPK